MFRIIIMIVWEAFEWETRAAKGAVCSELRWGLSFAPNSSGLRRLVLVIKYDVMKE